MGMQRGKESEVIWQTFGQSQRGASHDRSGMPNQDSIEYRVIPECQAAILAIADGHGSKEYFRSDAGSEYAVQIAVTEMSNFVRAYAARDVSEIGPLLKDLPQRIVAEWRKRVDEHLAETPFFTKEEWKHFKNGQSLPDVNKRPRVPYGATLLAVMITEAFIYCFQLGDGDIVFIKDTGEPIKPLADDKRLLANETTSLCTETAVQDVRSKFIRRESTLPALITISTDGYANSFTTQDGFLKVGTDILAMLRKDGPGMIKDNLPTWLESASNMGSGDDITFGVICHLPALKPPFPTPKSPIPAPKPSFSHSEDNLRRPPTDLPGGVADVEIDPTELAAPYNRNVPPPELPAAKPETEQAPNVYTPPPELSAAKPETKQAPPKGAEKAHKGKGVLSGDLIVSQNGRDGGYRTITEALKAISPGVPTTIRVRAGTYRERLIIERDVSLIAEDDRVVLESPVPTLSIHAQQVNIIGFRINGLIHDKEEKNNVAINVDGPDIRITNCRIMSRSQIGILVGGEHTKLTLQKCLIHKIEGTGIYFWKESQGVLNDCIIREVKKQGLCLMSRASVRIEENCKIEYNGGTGIYADNGTINIEKSFVTDNGEGGLYIRQTEVTIVDCTICENTERGIAAEDASSITMKKSFVTKNGKEGLFVKRTDTKIINCAIRRNAQGGIAAEEGSSVNIQGGAIDAQGKSDALTLKGGSRADIHLCAISAENGTGVIVEGVSFIDLKGGSIETHGENAALLLEDESAGHVTNCRIKGEHGRGVTIADKSQMHIRGGTIEVTETRTALVFEKDSQGNTVESCEIKSHKGCAITIADQCSVTIQDSHIMTRSQKRAILIRDSQVTIKESTIWILDKTVEVWGNAIALFENCTVNGNNEWAKWNMGYRITGSDGTFLSPRSPGGIHPTKFNRTH